jgi:drug/metabolite transporter (DMT)-like permease
MLLNETMGWLQIAGGITVLIGIFVVHQAEATK